MVLGCMELTGCTMGPNFKTPAPPAPASFVATAAAPVASAAVDRDFDPAWWNVFNDPELSSLESRVASANLDVASATIRIAESRSQQSIVSSAALPSVNADASGTAERVSKEGVFSLFGGGASSNTSGANAVSSKGISLQPFSVYQYGFDASWELDLWGKVKRAGEAAAANTASAEDARRGALVSALAEVARDYVSLRGVQTEISIARQNLAVAQQSLQLTTDRTNNGLTSQLDVEQATAALDDVQAQIPSLEDQQSQMINRLSFLLGETPGALAPELAQAQPVPPVPPRVPVGLPSELAQRRPDIRQAAEELHAATAEIGMAKADFYPAISLTGSFDMQALQLQNLGMWGARTFAAGPALSLPIFEGGKLRATLQLRQAQQQESAIAYQRVVLSAWHEIDDALSAYRAEQQRRDQLVGAADAQQKSLDLARDRYKQGLSDFLDVLDAQRALLATQQELAASTSNVSGDLVGLYKALGGGWETSYPAKRS
jgi:NodT family efflux transporter outer membrane factor (OMF) lipoprotein